MILDLKDADSVEFNPDTKNPVIHIMEDQKNITKKGGTMRLGAYPCVLEKGTLASNLYGSEEISERHRHRYEFNNDYKKKMKEKKMDILWNISRRQSGRDCRNKKSSILYSSTIPSRI